MGGGLNTGTRSSPFCQKPSSALVSFPPRAASGRVLRNKTVMKVGVLHLPSGSFLFVASRVHRVSVESSGPSRPVEILKALMVQVNVRCNQLVFIIDVVHCLLPCESVWPRGKAEGPRVCFGCPFSSKVVVCGHCLVTLSLKH